jgi:transposase
VDSRFKFVEDYGFADLDQVLDGPSICFEGSRAELARLGHVRGKKPDKLQLNFGIATGINRVRLL